MALYHFYSKSDDGAVEELGAWNWASLDEGLAFFDADEECKRTRQPITWWGHIGVATEDLKNTPFAMPAPKTIADLHRHPYPPIIDLKALAREEKKFKQQEYLEGQRALSGRLGWA